MIRLFGLPQTLARFAAVSARTAAATELAQRSLADEVADFARTSHPWQNVTGETEGSIEVTDRGVRSAGASVFLEFGTSKMAARPFMRPAAEAASGDAAATVVRRALGI